MNDADGAAGDEWVECECYCYEDVFKYEYWRWWTYDVEQWECFVDGVCDGDGIGWYANSNWYEWCIVLEC